MKLKKIQRRIVEIQKILSDEKRQKEMAVGVAMPVFLGRLKEANRPLLNELKVLDKQEQFLNSRRQFFITLFVGLSSIAISSIVAFGVPQYQSVLKQNSEIQSVYKNLITNQDIFISNGNNVRNLLSNNNVSNLPEYFLGDSIDNDARKIIQETFGLVQYRFFLYYIQQTNLLNEEIEHLRTYLISTGSESPGFLNSKKVYLGTMDYLNGEELKTTKFNYQEDTGCLEYFFEYNFSYLTIDGRGKIPECSADSLNRLFYHFGYLPDETPKWLLPKLKKALNQRESGLGDRVINL